MSALRQLEACVRILVKANGAFVPQKDLYRAARDIDPTTAHTQKRSQLDYCERFRPWLLRYTYPAVQEYVHEYGSAGHKQTRISFYMCPTGAESARNLVGSMGGLLSEAERRDVTTRLRALPMQEYMAMLPDHASRRVLRSVLLDASGSASFLNGTFGFNVGSLYRARKRTSLALLHSAECEQHAQSVRSDLTVGGQHRHYLQCVQEARAAHIADRHAGGAESKAEQCEGVGLCLVTIIEEVADQLGEFSFEEVTDRVAEGHAAVGSAPISGARGSRTNGQGWHERESRVRSDNCTWKNLAALVQQTVQKTIPDFHIEESTLRQYCMARRTITAEGRRHVHPEHAAQVKAARPTAKREDWNIDMHESCAEVAYFEELFAWYLANGVKVFYLPWDDHSKVEAGKKRGFASRR